MEASAQTGVRKGDGYAVGGLEDLGSGYGFRKVRQGLDVEAFGVNAIVMPPGYAGGFHHHEKQDELYFVHQGAMEIELGDGTTHQLPAGTFAHVAARTQRRLRNVGENDAIYLCVGGKDGYVGRDGVLADAQTRVSGPPGAAGA